MVFVFITLDWIIGLKNTKSTMNPCRQVSLREYVITES